MTTDEDLRLADYSEPTHDCDIVMKGGITSGVVYPHAVCELAQTYRFRNVGGTSAGAIAAAATAAAEYGRNRCGFGRLAALPAWIGAEENLKNLFQPQRSTRRLFEILIAALEGGPARACLTAIRKHLFAFLCGALPGLAIIALAVARGFDDGLDSPLVWMEGLAGFLLAVVGSALAICARITRQVTRSVPDNGFGLCAGGPSSTLKGSVPLTPWLSDTLNELAGLPKGAPLTFGHLWAGPTGSRECPPENPDKRHLQLLMMSTNLVNRRAHQLPWDSREWFFDPEEFRKLFPVEVVEWMENHPPKRRRTDNDKKVRESHIRRALMRPLLPLPSPEDLPVVVSTRMSLSFPILLSAVPLWFVDMTRKENEVLDEWRAWAGKQTKPWDPLTEDPAKWPAEGRPSSRPIAERCWFSDGGISSNFPVHFFDRLIPRWPTFAINLRPFAMGAARDDANQSKNTSMVTSNSDGIRPWWYRLPERPDGFGLKDKRIFGFLSSMIRTMQNRVDDAQMRVPGYRDRVAHVSMSEDEGGMNLTMPPATIAALTERGRAAAKLLHKAYTPPDEGQAITWDNHRWVRLRSSLAVLEQMHRHFAEGYSGNSEHDDERTYAELLTRGPDEGPPSYRWRSDGQRSLALVEIQAIIDAATAYNSEDSVARCAPRPTPQGRITPRD